MLRKERLMREIELGTLSTMRYRTLWQEKMMRIQMPRIAEDVEIAWRNFDRALDIKDYRSPCVSQNFYGYSTFSRISFLMDEVAEAEEQYQKNTRSHIEMIDRLLRSYTQRMECEENNYRKALNEALAQTDTGINKIYYQQNEIEISLQAITHGIQQQLEESLNNVKSITLSINLAQFYIIKVSILCNKFELLAFNCKIDAFMEDSKDIRRICAAQLENQLQGSWENLRQILSNYQNSKEISIIFNSVHLNVCTFIMNLLKNANIHATACLSNANYFYVETISNRQANIDQYDIILETKTRRKCYEALKDKDEKDQQVIAQQLLRTASLFEKIRKFRSKITTFDVLTKTEISEILTEHDFFQKAFWIVKNRLLSEQMQDKNQLKILSIEYNKTIKYLRCLVAKGKRLLTLMQICRKYETQSEKVIPFADHMAPENVQTPPPHQTFSSLDWSVSCQVAEDFQDLTNFWRRLGLVQTTTMQLRSEKDKLKAEASYLHECISCYMIQKGRVNE
ncbi:PREDICTED: coiled-coil domain-containing protein 65-like [Vollenhovia emeryi]|uniref:coiled-coil domain-containing protein 65-like n=1 Tax=Vollenhovia emeryi TaxID=411798 RepID=UPI0005F46CDD|nr:PREDICTED: coiled-coil domain-containing protein 65-like [Vollenhovia emeryi]